MGNGTESAQEVTSAEGPVIDQDYDPATYWTSNIEELLFDGKYRTFATKPDGQANITAEIDNAEYLYAVIAGNGKQIEAAYQDGYCYVIYEDKAIKYPAEKFDNASFCLLEMDRLQQMRFIGSEDGVDEFSFDLQIALVATAYVNHEEKTLKSVNAGTMEILVDELTERSFDVSEYADAEEVDALSAQIQFMEWSNEMWAATPQ